VAGILGQDIQIWAVLKNKYLSILIFKKINLSPASHGAGCYQSDDTL